MKTPRLATAMVRTRRSRVETDASVYSTMRPTLMSMDSMSLANRATMRPNGVVSCVITKTQSSEPASTTMSQQRIAVVAVTYKEAALAVYNGVQKVAMHRLGCLVQSLLTPVLQSNVVRRAFDLAPPQVVGRSVPLTTPNPVWQWTRWCRG